MPSKKNDDILDEIFGDIFSNAHTQLIDLQKGNIELINKRKKIKKAEKYIKKKFPEYLEKKPTKKNSNSDTEDE